MKMSENNIMKHNYAIIGDIHSCYDSLVSLLNKVGLQIENTKLVNNIDRKIIFVGDFTDRGDKPVETLRLVMDMVASEQSLSLVLYPEREVVQISANNN